MVLQYEDLCYTRHMDKRGGDKKVPIVPRKAQVVFASIAGCCLLLLLAFVWLKPILAERSTEQAVQPTTTEVPKVANTGGEQTNTEAEAPAPAEQTNTNTQTSETNTPTQATQDKKDNASYTYVARNGDSFVLMARASIDRYAKSIHASMTPAQRVAAETLLMDRAGSPELDVEQRVTLSADDVKKAVEEAQSLSDDELDGWSYFADQIDFDTDNPPEPVADDAGSDDGGAAQQSAPTGNAVTDDGAPGATGGGDS